MMLRRTETWRKRLDEFIEGCKAGEFDDDCERHNKAISLATLIPECRDA